MLQFVFVCMGIYAPVDHMCRERCRCTVYIPTKHWAPALYKTHLVYRMPLMPYTPKFKIAYGRILADGIPSAIILADELNFGR